MFQALAPMNLYFLQADYGCTKSLIDECNISIFLFKILCSGFDLALHMKKFSLEDHFIIT